MNKENIVEIHDLHKKFDKGKITALNGINLQIKRGDFVSIIGPSGSGKSTLLNMIGALDKPDDGHIMVSGKDLTQNKGLSEFRSNEIGFIFQLHNLIPNLTVLENVQIPMYENQISASEMKERAIQLLEYMGLDDKSERKPPELSGGERQRVAIARALANKPSIILADEPTGSLDSKTSARILKILKDLHDQQNVTLILVSHDLNVASMADRTIKVLDGKVEG